MAINFLRLIHPEIILKEIKIHSGASQRERGSVPQTTGTDTFFTRDDKQSRGTIPMPAIARRPSTMSSLIPVELPQNSMVGQQRQQILELQFDKFPNPQSFLVWKIRFKNQVTASLHPLCRSLRSQPLLDLPVAAVRRQSLRRFRARHVCPGREQ